MPKRVWMAVFLPILMMIHSGNCRIPAAPQPRIDTPAVRYIATGQSVNCYTMENDQRIMCNGEAVFTCPGASRIIDYDILEGYCPGGMKAVGVLMRSGPAIYLEIETFPGNEMILAKEMTLYHPWKIRFADVDGDGAAEVCLGVMKKSPLHPLVTKRLFIFNLQRGLPPKWRGSRLARPFADFEFMPRQGARVRGANGATRLFTLEFNPTGWLCLNAYEWDSFGFTSIIAGGSGGAMGDGAALQRTFNAAAVLRRGILFRNGTYDPGLYILSKQQTVRVDQEEAFEQ